MGKLTRYDVFLNHRGPDLKTTFVSHLNAALRRAGRDSFLDAKSLVKGRHAFTSINKALAGVLVHVAIFSPRYAESKYCLNELCAMLESQKPVIPVFYDVEPENLRYTKVGPFAKAFRKHEKRGRDEDVVKWRAALLEVAGITGFRLVDCGGDTAELVERVVVAVLDALPASLLVPARQPIGLKDSTDYVIDMLHHMGDNAGVMGICGMGGIGKTTLAREVYNLEQSSFDSRCFLKDVKKAKGVAVMDLQMKMVTDLLQVDVKKVHWDYAQWFEQIGMLKVLIVIDDISERKQFDELIPNLTHLAPGSRILVTSRERDVLTNILMDISQGAVYHVPELSHSESLNLFIWCAFRTKSIDDVDAGFHKFVGEITTACCGLPLALEVMGGFLADKKNMPEDEKYWDEATLALRTNGEIISSLQISYDGLVNTEDKRMFLDLACFMLGHPKEVAMEVWNSIGDCGSSSWSLRRLVDKCLVKVDGEGRLSMHDLLRDMGRNVVMQKALFKPEMQSHVWDSSVAVKILQKEQVECMSEVLALSVVGLKAGIACQAEQYGRMRNLRYIFLDGCPVSGDFSSWSEELRWLQWRYCPLQQLPCSLKLSNLAVLDLAHSDCLTGVWAKDFELKFPCIELRVLILTNCTRLMKLPQHLSMVLKLKFVNLEGCLSLDSLPDSLGELSELEYLNLSGCKNLTSLPNSLVNLLNLRELLVKRCKRLRELPMQFGSLKSMVVFKASSAALEDLPWSFGLLQSLKAAHFGHCRWLQALCDNFGSLGRLRQLNLGWCKSLTELPDSFADLSNLEELELSWCELLQTLPPSICRLRNLRVLRMLGTALERLPESFGLLPSLTDADFDSCRELQNLGENFGWLRNLQKVNFSGCVSLIKLSDSFSDLSNLQELDLSHCYSLQKLPPSMRGLRKLQTFSMAESSIWELPEDFGLLDNLAEADFSGCHRLRNFGETFGCLTNLRKLNLKGCESLTELPESFPNLSNLETLNLSNCRSLQMLPSSMAQLKMLISTLEL